MNVLPQMKQELK